MGLIAARNTTPHTAEFDKLSERTEFSDYLSSAGIDFYEESLDDYLLGDCSDVHLRHAWLETQCAVV